MNLLGTGFSPLGTANVTRAGTALGALNTDANGAFNGVLTLAQNSGADEDLHGHGRPAPTLTASAQITVSSVRVGLARQRRTRATDEDQRARLHHRQDAVGARDAGKSKRKLKIGRL